MDTRCLFFAVYQVINPIFPTLAFNLRSLSCGSQLLLLRTVRAISLMDGEQANSRKNRQHWITPLFALRTPRVPFARLRRLYTCLHNGLASICLPSLRTTLTAGGSPLLRKGRRPGYLENLSAASENQGWKPPRFLEFPLPREETAVPEVPHGCLEASIRDRGWARVEQQRGWRARWPSHWLCSHL